MVFQNACVRRSGRSVTPGAPPLDGEVVNQLVILDEEAAEPGFFAELVEMFIRDAEGRMDEIAERLCEGDRREAGRIAHRLVGGAGGMGAIPLAGLLGHLDAGCREGDPPQALDALLAEVRSEFDRVRAMLERELEARNG